MRVTKTAQPSADGITTDVCVESTAVIDGRIVRLRAPCGSLWGISGADEQVHRHARELQTWLEGELQRAGLEVRGGIWRDE